MLKGFSKLSIPGLPKAVTGVEYDQLEGTLTVRKKSMLNYALVDNTDDMIRKCKVVLQLVSSDEVEPGTHTGKLSKEHKVKNWCLVLDNLKLTGDVKYPVKLEVPKGFGKPGAFIVRNHHTNEFLLKSLCINHPDGEVYFPCNSWVYNVNKYKYDRIFFSNRTYLPNTTPRGLVHFRGTEMSNLRGDGIGERNEWDRIYDYALYNDLGDPTQPGQTRPNLGGEEMPYPRRCRTGRKPYDIDPSMETSASASYYIPRDETFDCQKQTDFLVNTLTSVGHTIIPTIQGLLQGARNEFKCFGDLKALYYTGIKLDEDNNSNSVLKYAIPQIIKRRDFTTAVTFEGGCNLHPDDFWSKYAANVVGWMTDEEFGRQRLAGINPMQIALLTSFPVVSKLNDPKRFGDPTSAITHEDIEPYTEGMSVEQALEAKKLYILDYSDLYLPYVKRINQLKSSDSQVYASRVIFFLTKDNKMKPCAIELAVEDPTSRGKRVFTAPKTNEKDWMWALAKAHVRANDSGIHQLYSHWVQTHAVMEPFIISTNRQLSVMHPVHRLLVPHFKNTMNINSKARQQLVNHGGIIDTYFAPGKYALEFSSMLYGALWRFDDQGLPNDLLKRGMAVKNPGSESGVQLNFEGYPYAEDGLDLWCAFKSWVTAYVNIYYAADVEVQQDIELQNWWSEIRTRGHGDKKDAPGWPSMTSKASLIEISITIMWIASAHHAAVNFGQYAYSGFQPNQPASMRKAIPELDSNEHREMLCNPEMYFIQSHAKPEDLTRIMVTVEILSKHALEEEYIGQREDKKWTDNKEVRTAFEKFGARLKDAQDIMNDRNVRDLPNRCGPSQVPYTLLFPVSDKPGLTGKGVPNSVSI